MANIVKETGANTVGIPLVLSDGTSFVVPATVSVDVNGNPNPALPAGANNIGSVSISGGVIAQISGQTTSQVSSAASTNATQLRASGTSIFGIVATNTGAAVAFVKYYNKAAAIVVGTDVPMLTIAVPPNGVVAIQPVVPIQMSNGLSLAITNLGPDSDATAVAAGQIKLVTTYS